MTIFFFKSDSTMCILVCSTCYMFHSEQNNVYVLVIIFLSLDGIHAYTRQYHLRIIELPSIWLLCTLLYDPKVIRNLHRDCRTITLHTTYYSAASQLDVVHILLTTKSNKCLLLLMQYFYGFICWLHKHLFVNVIEVTYKPNYYSLQSI